jgi:hypothetical protein
MSRETGAPAGAPAEAQENNESAPYVFQASWDDLYSRSLETRTYSVKAWDAHRRARSRGGNPMEPREPSYFGRDLRIAARMIDLTYSNPKWWGEPLASGKLLEAALGSGIEETEREVKARLSWTLHSTREELEDLYRHQGMGAVFDFAELTAEERVVIDLTFDGRDQTSIVEATGKALGTVKVLRARAMHKLRALAEQEAV